MSEMTYYHYVACRPSFLYQLDDLLSLCHMSTQLSLSVRWLTIIISRVDPAFSMSEMTYYHYVASRPSILYEWDDLLSLCHVSTQPSLWVRWLTIIMSRVNPAFSMSEMTYYHYVASQPSLLYEWDDLLSLCRMSTQPSLSVRWLTIIISRVDPAFSMSEMTYYHYVASRPSILYEWDDLLSLCHVSTQPSLWVRWLTIIMSRVNPAFSMSEMTYYHYVASQPSLLYEWDDLLSLCRMSTQPSLWVRWLTIIMLRVDPAFSMSEMTYYNYVASRPSFLYKWDDLLSLCRESTQPSLWVRWLTIIMSCVDPAFSMSEMTYYHYVASRPSLLYEWDDLLSLCHVSTQPSLWVRWLTIIMSRVDPAFSMSEMTYYHYVASRPSLLYEWDDLLSLCHVSTQPSLWVRWLTIIMSRVDPAFSMSEMTYYHYVMCRPSLLYEWDDLLSLCRESTQPSLWVRWLTIIMSRVDPAFSMSEMTYYHYVMCRPSLLYEWDDLLSLCRESTQPSLWVRWLTIIMSRVDPAFSMSEMTYYHYVMCRPSLLYEWDDLLSLCRESTQPSLWVRWLTIIMSCVDPAFSMSEMTYYHYVASRPSLLYEWDDLLSLCRESTQPSLWVRWLTIIMSCVDPAFSMSEMTYYHNVASRPSLLYEWDDPLLEPLPLDVGRHWHVGHHVLEILDELARLHVQHGQVLVRVTLQVFQLDLALARRPLDVAGDLNQLEVGTEMRSLQMMFYGCIVSKLWFS